MRFGAPLVDGKVRCRLGGGNREILGGLLILGGTPEESGTVGLGDVRAAESLRAAGIATGRAGGGGAVLAGDGATICESLGGGGGGTLSCIATTFGLIGDVAGGEGFRMGTAGTARDIDEAGFGRVWGGVADGLSLRIAGGGRRGGRGAEPTGISCL